MGAASLLLHAGAVVAFGWLAIRSLDDSTAPRTLSPPRDVQLLHTFELPVLGDGTFEADREPDPTGDPVHPAGGNTVAHLDTGTAGAGGDKAVDMPALNLANRDERLRLSPDLVSRIDRDQIQRIRTGKERASFEDRRSTTHPMELTFLASGVGHHAERRVAAPSNPSRGAQAARAPVVRGGELGTPEREKGIEEERLHVGMARTGSRDSSPGAGVREGRVGVDHRATAAIALARPDVVEGPVTIPASVKGRARDASESDQEVATTVRALVHASTAGGLRGDGRGGSGGGGSPGAGAAAGKGSRARALGTGGGDFIDFDTSDPRLMPYFRHLHAKIDPLWRNAFPKSAVLEQKQGMVILEFIVRPDGSVSVSWPPVRPSGVDEFDRGCAAAIRRAAPFDPLPGELGRAPLRIRAPFVARNPVVP